MREFQLAYRWAYLQRISEEAGYVKRLGDGQFGLTAVSFRKICDFWLSHLQDDPLFLLDDATRQSVDRKLEALGRRFQLADFERPV